MPPPLAGAPPGPLWVQSEADQTLPSRASGALRRRAKGGGWKERGGKSVCVYKYAKGGRFDFCRRILMLVYVSMHCLLISFDLDTRILKFF